MFIDELEIFVMAGHGGSGCVSFRREKYVEFGGPNGGNGGDGGSVIARVMPAFNTLLPLRTQKHYRAGRGGNGRGSNMTGANGRDHILQVPSGTLIRDRETGTLLGDLTRAGEEIVIAHGGRGGKGNKHFATPTNRAPKFAQPGEEGESLWIKLELKMIADVGLVGFPNAGKSTLISRISSARPKVADYPFTTLVPNLGVVSAGSYESFVVADIPGIIEGAHDGAGLGLRFLRHIERTSLLLLMIDPSDPQRDPYSCYETLLTELNSFSSKLARKKIVVAFTKTDLPDAHPQASTRLRERLGAEKIQLFCFSAVTGEGIAPLIHGLNELIGAEKAAGPEPEPPEEEPVTVSEEVDPLDEIR